MPWIWRMTLTISSRFGFESLQIVAVDLGGQLAFHAADGLFHVVFDGLRKSPDDAGNLLEFALHGGDQFVFVLVEDRRHCSFGFRSTKYSVLKKPVVSVPSSGRPTWLVHCGTSGKEQRMMRAWFATRMPSSGPVLGASVPRTQSAPSSRCGRNSEPMAPLKAR